MELTQGDRTNAHMLIWVGTELERTMEITSCSSLDFERLLVKLEMLFNVCFKGYLQQSPMEVPDNAHP